MGRSYGYLYEETEKSSTTEIAKRMRADIKTAKAEGLLPATWSYSVRTQYFAGGSSIDVTVKNCPDAWQECDGIVPGSWQELPSGNRVGESCGNVWCKAGGQYKEHPSAAYHNVLTEEARAAQMTLERIHNAYNHTGSDISSDYFDVNYYGSVTFDR